MPAPAVVSAPVCLSALDGHDVLLRSTTTSPVATYRPHPARPDRQIDRPDRWTTAAGRRRSRCDAASRQHDIVDLRVAAGTGIRRWRATWSTATTVAANLGESRLTSVRCWSTARASRG
jgi:hypothetical protein